MSEIKYYKIANDIFFDEEFYDLNIAYAESKCGKESAKACDDLIIAFAKLLKKYFPPEASHE